MGQRIAKAGDGIGPVMDTHTIINTITGATQPQECPFNGNFNPGTLESNVKVNGNPVATIESKVNNLIVHVPLPSYTFVSAPSNIGEITSCSVNVKVNGKKVAKAGDPCSTCTEVPQSPAPQVEVRNPVNVCIGLISPGGN
ncbi:MAG: hypothetical protein EPN57_04475 [Paraburkholderia sp.]|nr:MAG: hypothetical protein EPN57_04475 [Paraburkholderia sp.]